MNIGFFVRHFFDRGTEVAIYDYAKYAKNYHRVNIYNHWSKYRYLLNDDDPYPY